MHEILYPQKLHTILCIVCVLCCVGDCAFVSQTDEGDLYQIPPLGRHYSLQWAMEDMEDERREGGRALENMDTGNRGSWKNESGRP